MAQRADVARRRRGRETTVADDDDEQAGRGIGEDDPVPAQIAAMRKAIGKNEICQWKRATFPPCRLGSNGAARSSTLGVPKPRLPVSIPAQSRCPGFDFHSSSWTARMWVSSEIGISFEDRPHAYGALTGPVPGANRPIQSTVDLTSPMWGENGANMAELMRLRKRDAMRSEGEGMA